MKNITLAIMFAAKKHDGQTRRNKTPYIYHPIRVADKLKQDGWPDVVQITALLHDVLEDTNTAKEELIVMFDDEIADAVDLLTRKPGMTEDVYVSNILSNQIAKAVKEVDKIDNILESVSKIRNDADYQFADHYVRKARKYYYNKFSKELNTVIEDAEKKLEKSKMKPSLPDFSDERMQFFEIWGNYCCTLHLNDCQIGAECECWTYDPETITWNQCKLDIVDNYGDITLISVDKSVLPELKTI